MNPDGQSQSRCPPRRRPHQRPMVTPHGSSRLLRWRVNRMIGLWGVLLFPRLKNVKSISRVSAWPSLNPGDVIRWTLGT